MAFEPDTAATLTHSRMHARRPGRGDGAWRLAVQPRSATCIAVALTFLGLLAITFFIGRVVPIDPVLAAVGDRAPAAVYEAARLEMGLDKPLPVQFLNYVGAVLSGDLGTSVSTGKPVADDLKRVFPATLEMATLGIIIGVLLGVPMGVYRRQPPGQARRPGHPRRRAARLFRAGLLAGPGRARGVLRQAEMGRRPRPHRHLL